jgi:hypothetical protein
MFNQTLMYNKLPPQNHVLGRLGHVGCWCDEPTFLDLTGGELAELGRALGAPPSGADGNGAMTQQNPERNVYRAEN